MQEQTNFTNRYYSIPKDWITPAERLKRLNIVNNDKPKLFPRILIGVIFGVIITVQLLAGRLL